MPYVCTLHDWVPAIHNNDYEVILKVLGVFPTREEAVQYSQSFDFGTSDKWIEVHEFHGTEHRKIGEIDKSGFSE
jgi:hypothetical protein